MPCPSANAAGLVAAVGCAVALGCGAPPPGADNPPAAEAASKTAPSVEEIEGVTAAEVLAKLTATYRQATTYFDNARYYERFVQRGDGVPREPLPHEVSVAYQRPGRLRISRAAPGEDGAAIKVVLTTDGDRLRVASTDREGELLDREAPALVDRSALDAAGEACSELFPVPLENLYPQLDLLLADGEPEFLASADVALLASEALDGAPCYRLRIDRPAGQYTAWVDKQTGLLRRLEMPTDEVRRQLDPDGSLMRLELWIDFHDADIGTPIGLPTFQRIPGDGVELVESFGDATARPADPAAAADPSPATE